MSKRSDSGYFYFILFSTLFLGIVSSILYVNKKPIVVQKAKEIIKKSVYLEIAFNRNKSSVPILSAKSYAIYDETTDTFLLTKNADEKLLPASTSKIATALVALESYPLDEEIVVDNPKVEGQKMGLFNGEVISVESLIHGLLIESANDAAMALASHYPGGTESFVTKMNELVVDMGLENTHFENPVGYDGYTQYTTSKDLITLSLQAMRNPVFSDIVGKSQWQVSNQDGSVMHHLSNVNQLLDQVEGVMGVKTGWTQNAKENLVTFIQRDGKKIYLAVLGSEDRFGDTKKLIEWVFENYDWVQVKKVIYI